MCVLACVCPPLTFFRHSYFEALLQPAVLAAVTRHLVDLAVLVPVAGVHHVLLDTAAEEALSKAKCIYRSDDLFSKCVGMLSLERAGAPCNAGSGQQRAAPRHENQSVAELRLVQKKIREK